MIERLGFATLALAFGLVTFGLWRRSSREIRERARARKGYFDLCLPLFERYEAGLAPTGFARINGWRRGSLFDLQALPDSLTFRKLPCLWLAVSLVQPMPVAGVTSLMRRPTGNEPFSRHARLPASLAATPGLPKDLALRTDRPDAPCDPVLLARHVGVLFEEPRVKEVVIDPKGLRLVWLSEEANRRRYLLFREAELGRTAFAVDAMDEILNGLEALRDDLLTVSGRS